MLCSSYLKKAILKVGLNFKLQLHNARLTTSIMTSFVEKQLHLLEIEHLTEIEEKNFETANSSLKLLQRKGICIPKLVINSLETGLYDRSIATFSLRTINKTFPFNILSPGDIVKLSHSEEQFLAEEDCNGIVSKISDENVSVAFDSLAFRDVLDRINQHGKSVALIKVANRATYERLKQAMKDLSKGSGPSRYLVDVMFGDAAPSSGDVFDIAFLNERLNSSQRAAVQFALSQREVAIIHGPPGTGKTTTVIEIIAQLVKSGLKVLACAPSNVAVDNLLEKLSSLRIDTSRHGQQSKSYARNLRLVRIGHPARILDPRLQELSLDALVFRSGAANLIRDVRNDIEKVQTKLRSCSDKNQHRLLYQERRNLTKELRQREKKAIRDILLPADVVLATNVGAYPRGPMHNLPLDHFDVVVIDECGQALEAACWVPLLRARKCILAGDHLQLSPTIMSSEAAEEGLSLTLLERLTKLHGDHVVRMLTEQYRMHSDIMRWSSKQMYSDKLTAHHSVEGHLLSDLPNVEATEDTSTPLLLIDTSGCEMTEAESEESDSKANEGEVRIVSKHLANLIDAGVDPQDIAVISPYNLQVDILRNIFHEKFPRLEIKSVDGFQGREKEAVLLSLVRSNPDRDVGFLSDKRRLNVAVTRARRHIAIVCDSETVSNDEFIKSLLDYMNEHGQVRSGFEYQDMDDEDVLSVINSFHLIAPATTSKSSSAKSVNKKNPTSIKTKKKEKDGVEKSRDQPESSSLDQELKETYRRIIKKYEEILRVDPGTDVTRGSDVPEDLSDALDIEASVEERKMTFPSTLTSHERKIVHEVSSELSLTHHSYGEGSDRRVCVSFPLNTPEHSTANEDEVSAREQSCGNENIEDELSLHEDADDVEGVDDVMGVDDVKGVGDVEGVEEGVHQLTVAEDAPPLNPVSAVESNTVVTVLDPGHVICEKCGKTLPVDNLTMHAMHCERLMRLKAKAASSERVKQTRVKSSNLKQKVGKTKLARKQDFTNDDDVIGAAMTSNKICGHVNCRSKVSVVGQLCSICRRTFCMNHSLPEVHGCGVRVREAARRQIIRDGVLYPGSGTPNRKPPPDKRAVMKRRLDSKLKTMEETRKGNVKSKR